LLAGSDHNIFFDKKLSGYISMSTS